MKETDQFYMQHEEPVRSCLMALRQIVLDQNTDVSEAWKYRMPFFCYKDKMFCYLWVEKKTGLPYLGIVEGGSIDHPGLIQEARSRMKIIRFDPVRDLPVDTIRDILDRVLSLYINGTVKVKKAVTLMK
jgi:hypothetical protein